MALNIKDPETDRLARELASVTGETLTTAVKRALSERLRVERRRCGRASADELLAIAREIAELPVLDDRTPDEIIGYDERGLPR